MNWHVGHAVVFWPAPCWSKISLVLFNCHTVVQVGAVSHPSCDVSADGGFRV